MTNVFKALPHVRTRSTYADLICIDINEYGPIGLKGLAAIFSLRVKDVIVSTQWLRYHKSIEKKRKTALLLGLPIPAPKP